MSECNCELSSAKPGRGIRDQLNTLDLIDFLAVRLDTD
jgi:hypothetical protein